MIALRAGPVSRGDASRSLQATRPPASYWNRSPRKVSTVATRPSHVARRTDGTSKRPGLAPAGGGKAGRFGYGRAASERARGRVARAAYPCAVHTQSAADIRGEL